MVITLMYKGLEIELMSLTGAAKRAGVSVPVASRAARNGELCGVCDEEEGGRWTFTSEAVDAWIAERRSCSLCTRPRHVCRCHPSQK